MSAEIAMPEAKPAHPHLAAYESYKAEPSTKNLNAVIGHLQPTINGALRSLGADNDPAISLKAKILAARAVRTYDPSYGASLPTWVSQQMQPLRRYRRTALSPTKVPERMQLEAVHIMQGENTFREKYDRDPDLVELADHLKMPIKRIEDIRKTFRRVANESDFGGDMPSQNPETDFSHEALDYIYPTADRIDKRIIEMKTGYGGGFEPMEPSVIARRLNLSPVQLTRRSAKLSAQVKEIRDALTSVNQ